MKEENVVKIGDPNDGRSLRLRLERSGPQALSNPELAACILHAEPGEADIQAAGELIRQAGGLRGLIQSSPRFDAVRELSARYLTEGVRGQVVTKPADSMEMLAARLAHLPYEVFACLYLDNCHRVLEFEELFRGTIDGASVHPREVVRACLKHNAAAVIFAHNHPSGVAEPSMADRAITRQLREALDLIGVRVLDHIVIGAGQGTSMSEKGLI